MRVVKQRILGAYLNRNVLLAQAQMLGSLRDAGPRAPLVSAFLTEASVECCVTVVPTVVDINIGLPSRRNRPHRGRLRFPIPFW